MILSLSVKLSIQYGNIPVSAVGYVSYGIIVCNTLKEIDVGEKLGKLAIKVVSKFNAKIVEPNVLTIAGLLIFHRTSHLNTTLAILQNSYTIALEIGNQEFAGYSAHVFVSILFGAVNLLPL